MTSREEIRRQLLSKFREVTTDRVERITEGLLALERGRVTDATQDLAHELHTLKGEAQMMGFQGISEVVHAAEDLLKLVTPGTRGPRLEALLDACDAIPALLDSSPPASASSLARRLRDLSSDEHGEARPAEPAVHQGRSIEREPTEVPRTPGHLELRAPTGSIRVDVDRLDEIATLAGDLVVEGARAKRRTKELASLFTRWNRLSDRIVELAERARAAGGQELADSIEREVHPLRSDAFRFLRRHADAVESVHAHFGLMADRISSARLVPLASILAGFPRAARDLARMRGKEVDCFVAGTDLGVDKAILLSLNDPLVHLLRNAIDHGIELPADRERAGKPPIGRVTIDARMEGKLLTIVVEDDGRGLDPERIREKAVSRGLLGAAPVAALSDRAILDLVFMPNFSTREHADDLSGRGVGLDVVRRKVKELGGSAAVESELGRGARFTIRVPQSLALMRALLVRVDDDVFGIPAVDVESVSRIDQQSFTELAGVQVVKHRDRLVPVVSLGRLLSLGDGPRSRRPCVAFLEHGTDAIALLVDGLRGEREVSVKRLGAFLDGKRFVSGGAALEDGRVAVLLSTADLVAATRLGHARLGALASSPGRRRVLLVDDSAVARETEAALLRSLGYDVDEAADGEEGWRKLQRERVDLLLVDVQMPVLDGIGLTRRVKESVSHDRLPIVILSSFGAPEERRRGVEAGADAYVTKGDLEPERFARLLDRLLGASR